MEAKRAYNRRIAHIDYTAGVTAQNGPATAIAQYPNGTTVLYEAMNGATLYATRIRDANGNFISVSYVNNQGPQIQSIQDTIGRTIEFEYDSNDHLTAIVRSWFKGVLNARWSAFITCPSLLSI